MVDDTPRRSESGGWWARLHLVSVVVGALVTTLATVAGSLIYARVTAIERKLEYEVSKTPPLIGAVENALLYTVSVRNAGEREVTDVRVGVDLEGGILEDHEVQAPAALEIDDEVSSGGDRLIVEIPELNPQDQVEVALLVDSGSGSLETPEVDVRGTGVVGTLPQRDSDSLDWPWLLSPVVPLVTLTLLLLARGMTRSPSGLQDEPRGVTFAHVCLKHGLLHLARDFLSRPRISRWWIESNYLTARSLAGEIEISPVETAAILQDVVEEASMAKRSRAIFYVDIARLKKAGGDTAGVRAALRNAVQLDRAARQRVQSLYPELQEDLPE